MRSIAEILDKIKEIKKIKSDTELADFFEVKQSTLASWRARESIPHDIIIAFCNNENISLDWLLRGQGLRQIETEESKLPEEYVFVPQVGGKISAGGGLVPENHIEMRIAFRRAWIMKRGDPKNMALIKVSGDSMEPTLQSGDLVLVDHGRNYLDPQGGIYAIAVDDTLMIKRLQTDYPSKKVKIISDNSKYSPMEADIDQVKINGKVIWFGREIER